MKWFLPLLGLGFGVALAVIIGQRMSTDAMAVVIGVAVGVAASIPTSVLMVALMRRSQRSQEMRYQPPPMPQYPPVQVPPIMLDPSALFGRMQQPGPTMTVGENFQLLPGTKSDERFRFDAPPPGWSD